MLKRKVMVLHGHKGKYLAQVNSFLNGKIPPLPVTNRKERSRMANRQLMSGAADGGGNANGQMFKTLVYITRNKPTLSSSNGSTLVSDNVLLAGSDRYSCNNSHKSSTPLKLQAYTAKDKQCRGITMTKQQRTRSMNVRKKLFQTRKPTTSTSTKQSDNGEAKVNSFLRNEFTSVRLGIEAQAREGVLVLNKEINLNFSLFKPQLLSPRCLPDKHRKLSKYVSLSNANKPHHQAIPLKLLNNTYNINTIRSNYSFVKKYNVNAVNPNQSASPRACMCSDHKRNRWRIAAYFCTQQLNRLKIPSLSAIFDNPQLNLNPSLPFEHSYSQQCFHFVKTGDKSAFTNIVTRHRLVLLDFDASHQNIVHWLIKRNKYDYISFAGAKGACLNFRDFTGKTPLHYACTYGHVESVMVLLFEMANPFIVDNNDKTCEQYLTHDQAQYCLNKHKQITKMIKRAKALHLLHMNGKLRSYSDRVRKGLYFLYVYQLRLEFNFEKYCMYDSVNGYYIHFDDEQWNRINEFIKLEEELYKKQQLLSIK